MSHAQQACARCCRVAVPGKDPVVAITCTVTTFHAAGTTGGGAAAAAAASTGGARAAGAATGGAAVPAVVVEEGEGDEGEGGGDDFEILLEEEVGWRCCPREPPCMLPFTSPLHAVLACCVLCAALLCSPYALPLCAFMHLCMLHQAIRQKCCPHKPRHHIIS